MLLLFAIFITSSSALVSIEPRIIGGRSEEITSVPYQAQVIYKGHHICGATIISEIWLISAAHCFQVRNSLVIRTGSKFRDEGVIHRIKKVVLASNYNPLTLENDISLVMLKKPILFNKNQKAIKVTSRPVQVGEKIIIAGYGTEKPEDSSHTLKVAHVPVVDRFLCMERHQPDPVTDRMFCAGIGDTDACQGDSGGPAVIDNYLVGIVSWGRDCGSEYFPGVYTDVYKYRNWIAKVTGIA